jgi:hypothetical protein
MIERQVISDRPASVAYLTNEFAPATADTAQYVKVLFDDGEMILLATGIPPAKGPTTIHGMSLAGWAAHIAEIDINHIDKAVRSGLIGGLDNTEIARSVVGSATINGIDGMTAVTRHHISQLARAAVTGLRRRKRKSPK